MPLESKWPDETTCNEELGGGTGSQQTGSEAFER
jgi:hypothetical protein